jgi:arginine exporter protein ArgO
LSGVTCDFLEETFWNKVFVLFGGSLVFFPSLSLVVFKEGCILLSVVWLITVPFKLAWLGFVDCQEMSICRQISLIFHAINVVTW